MRVERFFEKIKSFDFQQYYIWAILFLAAAVRFTGLVKRDFWYDEAFTGIAVKEEFSDMIQMIINDVHPPLYYVVLKFFSYFFDYSVFGIRLFSAVFGVLSIWAVFLLAKELFNKKAALYAALVAAISPFAIQYSQEARMYTMLVFLILLASLFFVKGLKTGKKKFFILWGLFTGLSMLVHYMGIIFSLSYAFVFLAWKIFDVDFEKKNFSTLATEILKKVSGIKNLVLGYAVAFLVFSPWLKMFFHHISIKGNNLSWVKKANLGDIVVNIQMFLFGTPLGEMSSGMPQPNELSGVAHVSIRMALAMLFGIGIVYLMRKESKKAVTSVLIFSTGFMFVIYLLSVFFPDQQYFVARYMLPAAYFIFIFIGLWLSRLRLPIVIFLFIFYLGLISLIIPLKNSQGYNEMVLQMDKYKNNDFYILNSFDYVITKYYLGADRLTLYNYDWPGYNPDFWAAIGKTLKRTENFDDLKNDPNALIISNKPLTKSNQYFDTTGLVLIDKYKNILVYKFQ